MLTKETAGALNKNRNEHNASLVFSGSNLNFPAKKPMSAKTKIGISFPITVSTLPLFAVLFYH